LSAVVADIQGSGGEASSFVTDATRDADIAALLSHAGPNVDLAIYNAGSNTPGRILEMEADYFESSWRVVALLRRALVEEVAVGAPCFQSRLHRRRGDSEIEEAQRGLVGLQLPGHSVASYAASACLRSARVSS
jgi:hypothetical protein